MISRKPNTTTETESYDYSSNTATASRSFATGRQVTQELYRQLLREELAKLEGAPASEQLDAARGLLDELVLSDQFSDFLTLSAYERLR